MIMGYLTCQKTYFSNFQPSSHNCMLISGVLIQLLMLLNSHDLGLPIWSGWYEMTSAIPLGLVMLDILIPSLLDL